MTQGKSTVGEMRGIKARMGFRLIVVFYFVVVIGPLFFTLRRIRTVSPGAEANRVVKVGFKVGEYAPDFELRSVDGTTLKLSSLRGEPVVVNFWATWCAPCKVEIPWLVQLDQAYRGQRVRIVGIALESGSADEIGKFAKEYGMKYPILLGNSATADKYGGVRFMPQSFFIARNGRIVKETVGLTDKSDLEGGMRALAEGR